MEFGAVTGTRKVFSTASDVPGFQVTLLPASSHNSVPSNTETHSIVGEKTPTQKNQSPQTQKPQILCSVRKLVGGGKRVGAEWEVWQSDGGGRCPTGLVPLPPCVLLSLGCHFFSLDRNGRLKTSEDMNTLK